MGKHCGIRNRFVQSDDSESGFRHRLMPHAHKKRKDRVAAADSWWRSFERKVREATQEQPEERPAAPSPAPKHVPQNTHVPGVLAASMLGATVFGRR